MGNGSGKGNREWGTGNGESNFPEDYSCHIGDQKMVLGNQLHSRTYSLFPIPNSLAIIHSIPLYIVLLGLLLVSGCSSKVRDTGFLDGGYEGFNAVEKQGFKLRIEEDAFKKNVPVEDWLVDLPEPGMKKIVVPEDTDVPTTSVMLFIVPEPEWAAESAFPDDPEKEKRVLLTLRERMYRYLLRVYPPPVRVRYNVTSNNPMLDQYYRPITIAMKITDFKKGNGLLRYIVGYGPGRAYVQIEGEIFDGYTRENKIGEFAIRRAHAGYPQGGINTAVFKDDYVMRYAVELAVFHLTNVLPEYIPAVEIIGPEPDPPSGRRWSEGQYEPLADDLL